MSPYKFLKFLPDANAAKSKSKDRSTKVGALALDDDLNVRGYGYNGFPRGVDDNREERHERPLKYKWTAHAEENLVAQAARIGSGLKGCTVVLTSLHPCTTCSRMLIQAGVVRILAPEIRDPGTGELRFNWSEDEKVAFEMLTEAGVEVLFYKEEENER